MAQNDMEVIMYKILKYLYECMKADVPPRMEDINCTCQMFQIPLRYWGMIMDELISRGLMLYQGWKMPYSITDSLS